MTTTRPVLARRFAARMTVAMLGANLAGALVVFTYLIAVVPDRPGTDATDTLVNVVVFAGYLVLATVLGVLGSVVAVRRLMGWLRPGHEIGEQDRRVTVRLPARLVRLYGALWLVAAVVFAGVNLATSWLAALEVSLTIAMGGLTTCALSYLLVERLVRPLVAEAMRDVTGPPPVVLGVRRRILLSWGLGTAIPLAGIGIAVVPVAGNTSGPLPVLFLCAVGLVVGLIAMEIAARSISDPVTAVTRALQDVGAGRLDSSLTVDDVSEIGQLQSGFNTMAQGLRERERLRDLFGRQVGDDVARLAVERGVQLGGERREAAVLFIDVIGSTALALTVEPEEVVRRLNAFYAVVVEVVSDHGGWVNKFQGDAALCVFGAPVDREDTPACALAAARCLVERLAPMPVDAAVGVSAGPVVAGHLGTESRFEYTVIGDPVNAAARLSELAKLEPGRLLADGAVVRRAGEEAAEWAVEGEVVLRGRGAPTLLARPRRPDAAAGQD